MALLRWMHLRKLVPLEELLAGAPAAPGVPAAVSRLQQKTVAPVASPKPVPPPASVPSSATRTDAAAPTFKDAFLAEIRKGKAVFYNTVVAQAQKIDVGADRVTFTFSANQRALKDMFDQNRAWLESIAQQASGRRIIVGAAQTDAPPAPDAEATKAADKKSALREQALADAGVQAMLEVFPAEIRDVEEM
jgi:hypothetical protein